MRVKEAQAIGKHLSRLAVEQLTPILNLGSQTRAFREQQQPHIDKFILRPLTDRGAEVIHADIQSGTGIDISGDIFDPIIQERIRSLGPRLILCCNMFEHVFDSRELAKVLISCLPPTGYIVVSVPYSYPYHLDPIDTYFRPSPNEVVKLFPEFRIESSEIVVDTTFFQELFRSKGTSEAITQIFKDAVKFFLPFRGGVEQWKARNHRYFWAFRPFKVTVVVLSRMPEL